MEYKSKPIKEYRKTISEDWLKDTILILGISAEEKKRAKFLGYDHTYYPLIEQDIDREGCFDLCKKARLPTPRKSGCYFCPFQRKAQWIELFTDHIELFKQVENIEDIAREKYKDKAYYFCRDLPIREQIKKWFKKDCDQGRMDFVELERHCLCEL
tara:strand:- start:1069 stop:1536 length:468 start_codon:yes stop_codon:yes gene_type:complete